MNLTSLPSVRAVERATRIRLRLASARGPRCKCSSTSPSLTPSRVLNRLAIVHTVKDGVPSVATNDLPVDNVVAV